jgi:enamine deaminase RidA (YjgF/YER057c/UK114 family)
MPDIINPPGLVRPVGFSHGVASRGGRMLFVAGQTAHNADGQVVAPGDVVGQYEQALRNIHVVVQAAGGTMHNIVKMTIYVQDRDLYKTHLRELGRVHHAFFGRYYPATALIEISRFFEDGVLIEIESIAMLDEPEASAS